MIKFFKRTHRGFENKYLSGDYPDKRGLQPQKSGYYVVSRENRVRDGLCFSLIEREANADEIAAFEAERKSAIVGDYIHEDKIGAGFALSYDNDGNPVNTPAFGVREKENFRDGYTYFHAYSDRLKSSFYFEDIPESYYRDIYLNADNRICVKGWYGHVVDCNGDKPPINGVEVCPTSLEAGWKAHEQKNVHEPYGFKKYALDGVYYVRYREYWARKLWGNEAIPMEMKLSWVAVFLATRYHHDSGGWSDDEMRYSKPSSTEYQAVVGDVSVKNEDEFYSASCENEYSRKVLVCKCEYQIDGKIVEEEIFFW